MYILLTCSRETGTPVICNVTALCSLSKTCLNTVVEEGSLSFKSMIIQDNKTKQKNSYITTSQHCNCVNTCFSLFTLMCNCGISLFLFKQSCITYSAQRTKEAAEEHDTSFYLLILFVHLYLTGQEQWSFGNVYRRQLQQLKRSLCAF